MSQFETDMDEYYENRLGRVEVHVPKNKLAPVIRELIQVERSLNTARKHLSRAHAEIDAFLRGEG